MRRGTPGWGLLTTGYALLALAGVAAILWPSPSVERAGGSMWATAWACLLVIGGSSSAYGAGRQLYRWEYAGLMPLVAVWLVYAIASFSLVATGLVDRLAGGLALLAVASMLAARWHDVATVRRAAREVGRHDIGRNDGD